MSDEPQPQQPNEGGAQRRPLPAEGPGTPGSRKGTTKRPDGPGTTEPTGTPGTAGTSGSAETAESTGTTDSPSPGGRVPGAPSTRDGKAGERPTGGRDSGSRPVPGARTGQADRTGQVDRPGQEPVSRPTAEAAAGQEANRAAQVTQGARGSGSRPVPKARTEEPDTRSPDGGRPPGAAPASTGTGRPATGAERTPGASDSAESTQVLRRVNAPRTPREQPGDTPKGTPGASGTAAPVPETTQVLRRVNAPRREQPPQPAAQTPATAGGAPRTGGAATAAAGTAPTAQAAGAGRTAATAPTDTATTTATASAAGDGNGGKKARRPKRTGWRRLFPTWRMLLGTVVVGALLIAGLLLLGYSLVKIPPANALAIKQSNVYLYADGSQLARDGQINRESVGLSQISKDAQRAILAAEDRDFYTESAIDPKAVLRAGWNTATGKGKQSGSTITQQYVKNYYLAQEQTVTRKAKEFIISVKLDREKSKDEILEGYLNTSYFGRNAYGIQAAAQAYYGRDAVDLDPARAAYLAALVNAPSEYDVVAHPENKAAAVARWNYVLDGMVTKGWLSAGERTGMKFPMPREQTVSTGLSGQRGYLVEAVKHYLTTNDIISPDALAAGGYRITTTLQKSRQNAFVKAVNDQLMSKLDKKNKYDNYVRAGGASVDPRTGKVVAMYGGIDYVKQYTNGATRGDFQVGSTFKPFVFASAVQNGSTTQDGRTITPNTSYDGTNMRPVQGWTGGGYAPENEDQKSYGDITVRQATDLSVNSVYAQMAVDVGPAKVKQTAVDLGVPADTQDLQPYPSIALGTATASVLDMAEAYATLANHGRHGTYTLIEKISKEGTDEVALPARRTRQAISREAADTTTSVLRSVVDNGTATAAQAAGRPAAGKTGTAEKDTAAWFAGYTPDLATVVAVMGQDPVTAEHRSLYYVMGQARMNGGGPPTQIWAQYTRDALSGKHVTGFDLRLQQGAENQPTNTPAPSAPATGGQDTGTPGTTAGTTTGGSTTTGGGTTSTGGTGTTGTTTGDTATDGGATTDGGTATTGGTTDAGTTDGGTTGTTPTGGTTGGLPGTTGTTDGGTPGTTGGTAGPRLTGRRE